MSGLVAPPAGADPDNAKVVADGWFPDVKLADLRNRVRLGEGVVTTDRLTAAIEGAMISAFRALAEWRAKRVLAGAEELADVTEETVNNKNQAVVLWERIVLYFTAAELADIHRDISATDEGLDRAEEKAESADDYRRMAYHAVADLLSIGAEVPVQRNKVSLI